MSETNSTLLAEILIDAARMLENRRLICPSSVRGRKVTRGMIRNAMQHLADLLDQEPAWLGVAPEGARDMAYGDVACALIGLARLEGFRGNGAGLPRTAVAAALRQAHEDLHPRRSLPLTA